MAEEGFCRLGGSVADYSLESADRVPHLMALSADDPVMLTFDHAVFDVANVAGDREVVVEGQVVLVPCHVSHGNPWV